MKKIILFSAILFSGVSIVNAQKNIDNVTVNVKLHPIQTIEVNGKNVNLVYKTKDHYESGVDKEMIDHLKIYSTGGFAIKVRSEDDDITNNINNETISSSSIKITAKKGSNGLKGVAFKAIKLGEAEDSGEFLITSNTGGINKTFDVTYAGMGGDKYVNKYFKDETEGVTIYSTTVTYTIEAN
ncbi:MAG: hypothetical protein ACOH2V_14550 [Candidatus Saccharimonadaceae bacterium]